MTRYRTFLIAPALLALASQFSARAEAGVIFDSGVTAAQVTGSRISDVGIPSYSAGEFTLSTGATVGQVEWTGTYAFGTTPGSLPVDDFVIQFYDFSGSAPSTTPLYSFAVGGAVNRTDTGLDVPGSSNSIFSYSAAIPDTYLAAGRYLISIVDKTSGSAGNYFAWTYGDSGAGVFFRFNSASAWSRTSGTDVMDFTLLAPVSVPEPSSLALISTGGIALLLLRRRSRSVPAKR